MFKTTSRPVFGKKASEECWFYRCSILYRF
uniref:Uncharacterized protein n=1 Tax=Arundo donax TaxID=35708 RepID=A0A0A9CF87_ARUDO